ncbi:hypothetical protein C8A01DRAFT_43378 [Parachaetomium inaequale]|uniref:Protein kinase domain-containing protein n=1 Tax=Parachaetomium inaequale TaxID=2588326 RepID=A0AAN6SVQ3_9PEZI|nr:hypothetical protein C8A01DRAFT_43378 [Parachaetomium inaequale]
MNPFSIISDLETCYKYGKALVDFCQRWKGADAELADRATTVELCWINTKAQMQLVTTLYPVLNDEIRRILDSSLAVLARKLDLAVVQVQKLQDPQSDARPGFLHFRRRAKGAKYAVYQSALDATIQDLENWQRRCETALDLNMRDPNPVIDEKLKTMREEKQTGGGAATKEHKFSTATSPLSLTGGIRDALQPRGAQPSIFLPTMPLFTFPIPFSRAKAACMPSSSKAARWFILDTLPCRPQTDVHALNNDVRDLARKLKRAHPFAFGLLNCKGVMRVFGQAPNLDLEGFDLVFNVPDGTDPRQMKSLRGLLLGTEGGGAPSLSRRVRLAQELATSVSYVHTFNFVHKNIRPESVLLFDGDTGSSKLAGSSVAATNRRSSFLIGFESFRSAGGKTSLMGDQDWEHNIYRHPERMGEFPAEEYRMQHDIYSLGVCLLEIGMWEPLVEYSGNDADPIPEYGRVCRDFAETEQPWICFKDYLVGLAQNELPRRMGDRYADVVVTCLTCLDRDSSFGDQGEVSDADGILVGVCFIETIFGQLNEIVL